MSKRIVVIHPDGKESEQAPEEPGFKGGLPTYNLMKQIVGGPIELVRVLREDLPGFVHTYMIANETGLIDGLPRNQRATDIYLANVRRQYPDNPQPWRAASDAMKADFPGATVIDASPPGYQDDPRICGTVIWFDGYTCDELLEMGL